jgi:kynurenine formamidase
LSARISSASSSDPDIGALNDIDPEKIVQAAHLVKKGKVYRLGHVLEYGMPYPPFHSPFLYSTFRRHAEARRLFGQETNSGAMNVRVEMCDHTGTHMDALNHISVGDEVYNGYDAEEITGTFGTSRLGVETTPGIITRGVLLDVASFRRVERLEHSEVIGRDELESVLKRDGLTIGRGDAVLISTGWGQLWMKNNEEYSKWPPGIELEGARWLAQMGVSIVGSDTWNVEFESPDRPSEVDAVHKFMIKEKGIRLIENLALEDLRKDGIREFLFVCTPLLFKGGSGSPVTPLAII